MAQRGKPIRKDSQRKGAVELRGEKDYGKELGLRERQRIERGLNLTS